MNLNNYIDADKQVDMAASADPVDIMSLESHIDHDTAVVDTALDTLEQIAHLTESMESAAGEMASSPVFYHNVQRQLEKLNSVMGLDAGEDGSVSMESADSESARTLSLEEAKEGLGAWVKKIWVAIRDTFRAIGRSIADLVAKVFGSLTKEVAKLKAIKDFEKAGFSSTGTKMSISNGNVLGMTTGMSISDITKGIEDMTKVMGDVDSKYIAKVGDAFKEAIDAFGVDDAKDFPSKVIKLGDGIASDLSINIEPTPIPGFNILVSKKAKLFKSSEESSISIPRIERAPKGDANKTGEISGVSPVSLENLVKAAIALGERAISNKAAVKAMSDQRKKVGEAMEDFIKRAETGKLKGVLDKGAAQLAVSGVNGLPAGFVSKSNSVAFSIVRGVRIVAEQATSGSK